VTEQELRELVRRVVVERVGSAEPCASARPALQVPPDVRLHVSHGLLRVLPGADAGGPCVIEPHVECTHCGFCQSLGH
jgi:hypothetical protein